MPNKREIKMILVYGTQLTLSQAAVYPMGLGVSALSCGTTSCPQSQFMSIETT